MVNFLRILPFSCFYGYLFAIFRSPTFLEPSPTAVQPTRQSSLLTAGMRFEAKILSTERVLAVLLNYNSTRELISAMESLASSSGMPVDIVVVDNDSSPQEKKVLEEFLSSNDNRCPVVKTFWNRANVGYAAGNNVALQWGLEKGYEYLLVMNSDATVTTDTLKTMVLTHRRRADLGAVVPLIMYHDTTKVWCAGTTLDREAGKIVNIGLGDTLGPHHQSPGEIDFCTGCAVLFNSRCLRDVGLFPEEYFLYFEDTAWSVLARRRGWNIYFKPEAIVNHYQQSAGKDKIPKNYYIYYFLRANHLFFDRFFPELMVRNNNQIQAFIKTHRRNIAAEDSSKVDTYDALVTKALQDGASNRTGPADIKDFVLG
jgi:GT2 family glycosyltransferase